MESVIEENIFMHLAAGHLFDLAAVWPFCTKEFDSILSIL